MTDPPVPRAGGFFVRIAKAQDKVDPPAKSRTCLALAAGAAPPR